MNEKMTFAQILENHEGRMLIEQIEELLHEEDAALVSIRTKLIAELKTKFGYAYIV